VANEILNSIVEMTGQRDLDSLEYSLTATLAELVPAQRVSLNKFLSDDDHDQIEEIVHLIINQVSKKENVMTGIMNLEYLQQMIILNSAWIR